MKRGDLATVVMPGEFSKPRPALIVQSDQFDKTGTVTVLPISSTLVDAPLLRLDVQPTPGNGLRKASQIMVDKVMSVKRNKVGRQVGRLEDETMLAVNRSLALFFGFG